MHIVQLMSGGFDSVAQALYLQSEGHVIYPLHIRFRKGGGKVAKEEQAVRIVSEMASFIKPHFMIHRIPREEYDTRNRVLVAVASGYAQEIGVSVVAIGSHMFEGIDLRGDFPREDADPRHLQGAAHNGIKVWASQTYKAPLLRSIPHNMQHIVFESTSCQMWYTDDCGKCFSCIERHAAFIVVMGYDHTTYTYDPKCSARWREYVLTEQRALEPKDEAT